MHTNNNKSKQRAKVDPKQTSPVRTENIIPPDKLRDRCIIYKPLHKSTRNYSLYCAFIDIHNICSIPTTMVRSTVVVIIINYSFYSSLPHPTHILTVHRHSPPLECPQAIYTCRVPRPRDSWIPTYYP